MPCQDNAAILEEFNTKLKEHTRQAHDGREFVLVDSFQRWLRSPIERGTHAERLLELVAYGNRKEPGIPITGDNFKPGDQCCLLVFCILQMLDHGSLIELFSRRGKVDRLLPLAPDDLLSIFQGAIFQGAKVKDQDLVSKFSTIQHRFRPARFELHSSTDWDENMVIPIYRMNPIKDGGTASLWQIDVPEDFVGESLRDVCSGSRFNTNTDEKPDWVRKRFARCSKISICSKL